jgi:arsenate reductase
MKTVIIYHNPRCSKSRQALEILKSNNIDPTIVEYLKAPLILEQLRELRSFFDLKDFVRTNEPAFTQLQLSLDDEMGVLEAMINEPILMQRPIVTCSGKAIIARPPEKLLEWMENF